MLGYRQRIASGAVARRAEQGPSTGEAIGAGLDGLGQTLDGVNRDNEKTQAQIDASKDRIAKEEERRWRSAQSATALGRYAEMQIRRSDGIDALQKGSKPGATGHRDAVEALIAKENDEFLGTLPDDPEIRERFTPLLADSAMRTVLTEGDWERTQAAKFEQTNVETFVQAGENRIMTVDGLDAHFALSDMDATVKAVALPKIKTRLGETAIEKLLLDGNWRQAEKLVASGVLEKRGIVLDNPAVMKRIGVEKDQEGNAIRARIGAQKLLVGDAIQAVEKRASAGEVLDRKELIALRDKAVAVGDLSGVASLDIIAEQSVANKYVTGKSMIEKVAIISDMEAQNAAGKLNGAGQIQLAQARKSVSAETINVAAKLKPEFAKGVPSQLAIVQQLQSLPPEQADDAAEQIRPGLGIVVRQSPRNRELALNGRAAREQVARKDDWGDKDDIREQFEATIGPLKSQPGFAYDQMMDHAHDLYVGISVARGKAGFDKGGFDIAVKRAFGGSVRASGVMQGGIGEVRGHVVQLPDYLTAPEFDATLSRMTFSDAVTASGPAAKADVLAHFRPEFAGDNKFGQPVYIFVGPDNKPLGRKGGGVFAVPMVQK
jgi:hypothetical protein